jgi:hypothetical protein
MRTTLDIDDDILAAAKERATAENIPIGRIISDLCRGALTSPAPGCLIERNGFFVLPSRGSVVTSALVRRLVRETDL